MTDWPSIHVAVADLLAKVVPCDEVVWTAVDMGSGRAAAFGPDAYLYEDRAVIQLLVELDDHPVKNHFLAPDPSEAKQPVRMSDLCSDREFRRTRTWSDLFHPRSVTRQLTVVTSSDLSRAATAWSFNRNGTDFSDADVAAIAALRPLLSALEASTLWRPDPDDVLQFSSWARWIDRPLTAMRAPEQAAGLTSRELEVLELK